MRPMWCHAPEPVVTSQAGTAMLNRLAKDATQRMVARGADKFHRLVWPFSVEIAITVVEPGPGGWVTSRGP